MKESLKPSWKSRRFVADDVQSLPRLYEAVSGYFDIAYWQWLFKENPSGHGHIWLAEGTKNKDIAGQYAITPTDFIIQGKKILGSQSLATMTHPDYRRQGIFTKLANKLYEDSKNRGVDLVYGFPNKNSSHGFLKYLDFFTLYQPKLFTRPMKFGPLLHSKLNNIAISKAAGSVLNLIYNLIFRRRLPKHCADIQIKRVERFPEDVDRICRVYNRTFKNMAARSVQYLNWRFCDRPDRSYQIFLAYRSNEICGYCVIGHTERDQIKIGLIMDIFTDPGDVSTLKLLIYHLLNEMENAGEALASCLLQPSSPILKTLKKFGFVFPLTRFPPFILRVNSDNIKLSDINKLDDWHITFGDADFV
jgi:GNAT superfamily N-acetyltransferase